MSNQNTRKNNSFIAQAAILAFAGLFSRVIGFAYKLPMYAMIGDEGMGTFSSGYNVYQFLLVLSSAGIPAAVSRMVASRLALNKYKNAHDVFKASMIFALTVGLSGTLILFFGADYLSRQFGNPDTYYSILALSPTILVFAIMSVFRGYFQGMGNTVPTALSQIIEQIVNAFFSIFLTYIFYETSIAYAAAGGNAATGIGAVVGLLVVFGIYLINKNQILQDISANRSHASDESYKSIIKELIFTAFPIIAGTAIFSAASLIDNKMVISRLQFSGFFSQEESVALYGQLSQKFAAITTLPVTIATSMGTASIPGIAAAVVKKNKELVSARINLSIRLAMVISIPAAFGIGVFGDEILLLLFPSAHEGGMLLKVGFISVIFLALSQICTGVLQGIGKLHIPALAALAGCIVKIIVNYFLLAIPSLNVIGAVIGTTACYAVAAPLDMYFVYKYTGVKADMKGIFTKPLACSAVMSVICFFAYRLIYMIYPSNGLSLILAVFVGVTAYFLMMAICGGVIRSDFLTFSFGEKIIRALAKIGIDVK